MIHNVLVVCIGNICRSPIGEALLAEKLRLTHPDVRVSSAGLNAMVNHPADPTSLALMQARGIDISAHRARQITSEILFDSDLILTTTTDQQQQIEAQYSSTRGRVHRLGKWGSYDVPDPYRRPQAVFDQALILIDESVDEWYRKLWS
jgi:protein-tyrosine phosphatase